MVWSALIAEAWIMGTMMEQGVFFLFFLGFHQ